jgi:arylsulfatase A-like enzyme
VPGMIRLPGHIEPRISDVPNSTLDVMPTICELAGVQPPQDRALDRASLVGLLLEGKEVQRDN